MKKIEIKAAVFDVDGTLLPRGYKEILPSTMQALMKLRNDGIVLILASGRPFYNLPVQLTESIKFDYYICGAGSLIMDGNQKVIAEEKISMNICNEMIREVLKENGIICLHTPKQEYVVCKKHISDRYKKYLMLDQSIEQFQVKAGEEPNVLTIYVPESDEKAIQKKYVDCTFFRVSDLGLFDVVNKGVSKQSGLEVIESRCSLLPDNIMFFGDDYNDWESIKKCGLGIAMGNAVEEVKKAADYVTDSCECDGIAKALVRYGFLEYE